MKNQYFGDRRDLFKFDLLLDLVECQPESEKRAKRKGEEDAVAASHAGHAENRQPIRDHPIPAFWRIEPAERRAGRAAGLVKARVDVERKREVRPERRMPRLIGDYFGFRGEWHSRAKRGEGAADCQLSVILHFDAGMLHDLAPFADFGSHECGEVLRGRS